MPDIKPVSDLRNYTAVINEAEISIREEGTVSADELKALRVRITDTFM